LGTVDDKLRRIGHERGRDPESKAEKVLDLMKRKVEKLRELSPLWEMHKDGIDLSTIEWAAH